MSQNDKYPAISIIIPVYKVEDYLEQCLTSIVNQTYPNLEIILVDDGSPDKCPEMCDVWAKKDDRIKVLHLKNGGAAAARNAGLDIARGEYIGFVDSDDYIARDMYEILLKELEASDKKISCCYSETFFDNASPNVKALESYNTVIFDTVEAVDAIFSFKLGTSFWRRLYHRSVFESIRMPAGEINEEFPLLIPTAVLSGGTVLVEKELYYYRQRSVSVSKTAHLSAATSKCVLKNLKLMEQQLEEYRLPCKKNFSFFSAVNAYYMLISFEKRFEKLNDDLALLHKEYKKIARRNAWAFLSSKNNSIKDKILFVLILMRLFRPVYLLLKKKS